MSKLPIRRALVSVYDKTGLVELAKALGQAGGRLCPRVQLQQLLRELGLR